MIDFKKILSNEKKLAKVRPIIFEGLDASGKDYLRRGFSEYTKHRYICVTRMFVSSLVYTDLFGRAWKERDDTYTLLNKFVRTFNPCVVYCDATDDVLLKRIENRAEPLPTQELMLKTRQRYSQILRELIPHTNIVNVDTSNGESASKRDMKRLYERIIATLKNIDSMEA